MTHAQAQNEVNMLFVLLQECLGKVQLQTETGGHRVVTADEFMFMGIKDNTAQFKHRDTRNYVFLQNQRLIVPTSNKPFLKGTF